MDIDTITWELMNIDKNSLEVDGHYWEVDEC